jgi:hypothetical protein
MLLSPRLALLNERCMERHRFVGRWLQARKQEPEAHERHLEELDGVQKEESGSALLGEERQETYQKVPDLRERIWQMEQNLNRREQIELPSWIRKLSKRVTSNLRVRLPGR